MSDKSFDVMSTIDPDFAESFDRPMTQANADDLVERFADAYRSGVHGAEMDCDSAMALALAIDRLRSLLAAAEARLDHIQMHAFEDGHNMIVPKVEWDAAFRPQSSGDK